MAEEKLKTADWAPGTLDATRKAIGDIDRDEALKMSKVLGGEIMYEKAPEFSTPMPQKSSGRIVRPASQNSSKSGKTSKNKSKSSENQTVPMKSRRNKEQLAPISSKVDALIDKLMMTNEYSLKPNYGFFNFIKNFQKNGHEQVVTDLCAFKLKMQIENIQIFITSIKTFIQIAPNSYKAKIANCKWQRS